MIPGVVVDVAAILAIGGLAAMRVLEGRDAATAILVIVVGRLRPPSDAAAPGARGPMISSSGLVTVLAALGAAAKGRLFS